MKSALTSVSIGVLVVVALLSVNGWLSYLKTRSLAENLGQVAHTQEVLDSLANLRAQVMDGVASYRHYVITGDKRSVTVMEAAFEAALRELDRFAGLSGDNPDQRALVVQLRDELNQIRDFGTRAAVVRTMEGFEAAQSAIQTGDGVTAVTRIDELLTQAEATEQRLLVDRQRESQRAYTVAVATSVIATVTGLVAVALFGWIVRRLLLVQSRSAAAIDQQRQVLQATLLGIGDGVIATDALCRVVLLNPVAESLTGWPYEEARGKHIDEVFHIVNEDTRTPVVNPAARAIDDGRIVGLANHTVLIARDGVERAIDDSAAPIRDAAGRVTGAVLVFRDVSIRRQADRALAERTQLTEFELQIVSTLTRPGTLDDMLQQAVDTLVERLAGTFARVWTLNERENLLELRASAGQYDPADTTHGSIPVGDAHKIGAIALHRRPTLINAVVGDPRVEHQTWVAQQRITAFAGYPLLLEGRVVGVIGIFSREPLSEATLDVLSIVAGAIALAIERFKTEDALREADRRKDEFLAMLGHELRNPLAGIVTGVDVLKMLEATPEAAEMTAVIDRQASHMSRIVDDLLDVSRIARGKLGLRKELFDIRELVRHVVEDYTNSYILYDCEVEYEVPAGSVWVHGDRTRLAQVLTNLVHNGCKFCDGANRVVVKLQVDHEGGQAHLVVSDRGIGMTAETLRRVFEPFHQADTSLERSRGGLGLGLALVKGIVDLHEGSICATSEGLGCGTTVTVSLPLAEQPSAAAAVPADVPVSRRRVLLIDDRRDAILPVQKMLSLDGHEVATASDGPTGLQRYQEFHPEVVLCDIGLTGAMSGYDVIRAARSTCDVDGCYWVAVTGYGQDEDRRTAQAAGFDYHVTKPVSRDQLRQLMGRMPRFDG